MGRALTVVCLLWLGGPADARAQTDEVPPPEAEEEAEDQAGDETSEQAPPPGPDCVYVNRIRDADFPDDRTIVLRMRGGPDVRMNLMTRCPQLKFHGYFSYRPTLGKLCARFDRITTRSGFSCPIDSFSYITPDKDAGGETAEQADLDDRPRD